MIGCLVTIPISAILVRFFSRHFQKIHFFLSISTLANICCHMVVQQSIIAKILAFVCCLFWLSIYLIRLTRIIYFGKAEITEKDEDGEAISLNLHLENKQIFPYSDCYFYISFPDSTFVYKLFKNNPMTIFW